MERSCLRLHQSFGGTVRFEDTTNQVLQNRGQDHHSHISGSTVSRTFAHLLENTMKAHQVLLTDAEWDAVYAVYPRGIPIVHPILKEFAGLVSLGPASINEGTNQYRTIAEECGCWMCSHMLSLPVITGFHLYLFNLNRVCAGGHPGNQMN